MGQGKKVILIFSGGLDSTVLLYQLRSEGRQLRCLAVDYGQRHRRELEAAKAICQMLGVELFVADIGSLRPLLAGNSLTSDTVDVPEEPYSPENMRLTVVPNRNMLFLAIAISWAISSKFSAVAYAAHAGDHPVYPDCRPEFVRAMGEAASLCDWDEVGIETPFIDISKSEIVLLGASLGVPFADTWSCYQGGEVHCGKCATCRERREAFRLAGIADPTEYAAQ